MASLHGIENTDKTKGRKEWHMLLLSLLLAFIVWLIHSLSLTYSVFMEYNVHLTSSLESRVRSSLSEDVLIIRGKADGYYILKHRFGKRSTLNVSADANYVTKSDTAADDDRFYVRCEQIKGNIVDALGSAVELEFIVTESMDFEFPKVTSKMVPIIVKSAITYASQYMPMAELAIDPDSVEIFGEEKLLENIDSVWTETISYTRLDESVQGIAQLVPLRRIEYAQKSVYYTLNISRFIEETVTVKVEVANVPEGKSVIVLPAQVDLICRRTFGGDPLSADDVTLEVDYNELVKGIGSQAIPKFTLYPDNAVYYQLRPRYVDCLVIDNSK